ncbi:MAG TPA: sugar transferase [Planctomycetes bacterium]|nr:sugar transferase [Planctomycetota bacterium]
MFPGTLPAPPQGRVDRIFRSIRSIFVRPSRLGGVLTTSEFESRFRAERDRSDRFDQSFSMIVLTPGKGRRTDSMMASSVLLGRLRIYDTVGRLDSRRVAALLPETEPNDAYAVANGVVTRLGESELAYDAEVYSYPFDWADPDSIDSLESKEGTNQSRPGSSKAATGSSSPFKAVRSSAPRSSTSTAPTNLPHPEDAGLGYVDQRSSGHRSLPMDKHLIDPLPPGKRVADVIGSTVLLVLSSPILLVAALLVKVTSRGSIFYVCQRVGLGGKLFTFYKFRSMYQDADQRQQEDKERRPEVYAKRNAHAGSPIFKDVQDPRVTPVGRFLRRSSIDELPQLIHVLLGQMTLVGPRPPLPKEVAKYEPWQMQRLEVTGGLTCYWQVRGRSDIGFVEMMRMDIEYIRNRSAWLDFKLLLQTFGAVFSGRGAY